MVSPALNRVVVVSPSVESPTASPPNDLDLKVDALPDGTVVITPAGELDLGTVPRFDRALTDAESRGPRRIVIDLGSLAFMDSSGLRALLAARGRAAERAYRLVLVPGTPRIQRVFSITGTEPLFTFAD